MLSIGSLRSALSAERLRAYALPEDTDEVDGVARYLWNLALCSALQPALHTLEITVRNRLFQVSRRIVDETRLSFDKVPCWLDARPSLLADRERQAVEKAKETIARRRSPMTEGRLVSVLGFGFWVSLCRTPYEQGRSDGPRLWPQLATRGFPHLPAAKRTRSQIFDRWACRRMVDLLALAHDHCCEARLAAEIDAQLMAGQLPDAEILRDRFLPEPDSVPALATAVPPLSEYDDTCLNGAPA